MNTILKNFQPIGGFNMADTKNYETDTNNEKGSTSSQLTMSLAGGIIGAAIGYMVTSGNSKMLTEGIDMEKLSSKGSELSEAVVEKSRNLLQSVVNSATKLFEKQEDQTKEDSTGQENGSLNGWIGRVEEMLTQLVPDGTGQMLGEKKEQLQDRLGNIEEMLSKMVNEKNNQGKKGNEGNHDSTESDTQQQEQSQLNSSEEKDEDRKEDIPSGSRQEDKKKTSTGENPEEVKNYNQGSRDGNKESKNHQNSTNEKDQFNRTNAKSGKSGQENQEYTSSSQSNTSNKSYTMLNVDEDTHNLLEGLEKDI